MKNNGLKNAKAITLIAMVVTIIVLLILAGVSIAVLTGENGILNRATEAKQTHEEKTEEEKLKLGVLALSTEYRSQTTHAADEYKFSKFVNKEANKTKLANELGVAASAIEIDTAKDILTYRDKKYKLDNIGGIADYTPVAVTININGTDSQITEDEDMSNYYGKVVTNYTAGPSGKTTTWRIFYIDFKGKYGQEGTIYLKADYDPSRAVGLGAYMSYIPTDISKLAKMNQYWYANRVGADWSRGEHCTAALCETKRYASYVNENADFALGSPSVEMYCDSYNSVSHSETGGVGNYTIGASYRDDSSVVVHQEWGDFNRSQGYIYTIEGVQLSAEGDYRTMDDTLDYSQYGSMYAGLEGSKEGTWLLSSPSSEWEYSMCCVSGENACLSTHTTSNGIGYCPLVSLKSTFIPQISATN